jgi:DNA-binding GntR family transcriptional regulator
VPVTAPRSLPSRSRRAPRRRPLPPVTQGIASQIEHEILWGRFGPRERLVEEALCARFGVSRTPVREALRILEAKGLITIRASRGAHVREISWKEIEDLYAVRVALESVAMELAAGRLDDASIRAIGAKLHAMGQAARRNDVQRYFDADNQFRALVFGACGNEVLIELLTSVERRVQKFRFALLSLPGRLREAQRHHEAVFDALRRGDGKLAGELRRSRIENSKALLATFRPLQWGPPPARGR